MIRVLDLFSGIGGFSLGLERTGGFKTVAFCEIDPFCRRVLAKHWPEVPCYDDVRTIGAGRLAADGIAVDAICGGFPCQDVSCAGLRSGLEGDRSGLWFEYARIIDEVRPQLVIVENVGDLLVRGMSAVLGALASLGYDAEWHCIPAAAVGADHFRDRVWIIAYPNSDGAEQVYVGGRQQRAEEVGENAPNDLRARRARRFEAGAIGADANYIGARLGLALGSQAPFPGEYWNCKPVLGRGQYGIPDRVDRMHAIGNAVVHQIPEMIGRAYLEARQ